MLNKIYTKGAGTAQTWAVDCKPQEQIQKTSSQRPRSLKEMHTFIVMRLQISPDKPDSLELDFRLKKACEAFHG